MFNQRKVTEVTGVCPSFGLGVTLPMHVGLFLAEHTQTFSVRMLRSPLLDRVDQTILKYKECPKKKSRILMRTGQD